jgi:hypothetical protein
MFVFPSLRFKASPFSPLLFFYFVSSLSNLSQWLSSFQTSLPFQFQKSPLSRSKLPPAADVESSIYRLEGCRLLLRVGGKGAVCCCAWGAGHAAVGRPDRGRGALGSVTVPCFMGRGALGSVREEKQCQNNTVQFLFFIFFFNFNFIFILFMGYPKMGYNTHLTERN